MLEIGSIFDSQLKIIEVIGQGGMGVVYLARDLADGTEWALKEQRITRDNRGLLVSEAELLRRLSHPALPKLRYWRETDQFFYLVMEYIEGYTLEDVILAKGRVGETLAIEWFIQICRVLNYLHGLETPVVYRDFKPSNIMLDGSGNIRIIDFGIAQEYQNRSAKAKVVALTRGYAAPEQYDGRYYLDARTDIYALAVTMHYLLTGKDPNKPPYHFRPVRKLQKSLSYGIEFILKKCLQPNPDKRYRDVSQLLEDLEHMDALERRLKRSVIQKRAAGAAAAVLALSASVSVYYLNLKSRTSEIEQYYVWIEQAETAGSLEPMLQRLERAMELSPENPEAYILYAGAYVTYGQPEIALEFIDREIIPRFPDIYQDDGFLALIQEIEALQ